MINLKVFRMFNASVNKILCVKTPLTGSPVKSHFCTLIEVVAYSLKFALQHIFKSRELLRNLEEVLNCSRI